MKKQAAYGLLILTLCCSLSRLEAQAPFYKPAKYSWEVATPVYGSMDERFQSEDAVALHEYNRLRVYKSNPLYMTLVFEKKARIRYNNIKGIEEHSRFVLPESFDRSYDYHDVAITNRKNKLRPQYFDVEVEFFAARIIRPDGSVLDAAVEDSVAMDRLKYGVKYHDTWSFVFDVAGMEPGDELEVHYKYTVPYDVNWFRFNRNRVFFHGVLPKQSFQFEFRANVKQDLFVHSESRYALVKDNDVHTYTWNYEHMPGCTDEVNSRLYMDLPYFIYGLSQSNLRYRYTHNLSYERLDLPYWTYILKLRENRALWLRRVAKKRIPDKQNKKVKDFMAEVTAKGNYGNLIDKAVELHEYIVDEFDYVEDDAWFDDHHGGLQKMGDHVEDEKLQGTESI